MIKKKNANAEITHPDVIVYLLKNSLTSLIATWKAY